MVDCEPQLELPFEPDDLASIRVGYFVHNYQEPRLSVLEIRGIPHNSMFCSPPPENSCTGSISIHIFPDRYDPRTSFCETCGRLVDVNTIALMMSLFHEGYLSLITPQIHRRKVEQRGITI